MLGVNTFVVSFRRSSKAVVRVSLESHNIDLLFTSTGAGSRATSGAKLCTSVVISENAGYG